MPIINKRLLLGVVTLAATLLTGCATVTVENNSIGSVAAIVKLKVPDSTGYEVIKLAPGEAVGLLSIVGGAYSLIVLPDQEYVKKLDAIRDQLETNVVLHATETDPTIMLSVLENLKSMQSTIDKMQQGSAACAAHVGDYEDAYASVTWDQINKVWTAQCGGGVSNGSSF